MGDSNSVEPRGASRRHGYELVGFWRPVSWFILDGVYTVSHARGTDNPQGPYLEGAIERAGELGVSVVKGRWETSASSFPGHSLCP